MRGLPSILSLFRNEFNKFNNTRARMLDSIYHMIKFDTVKSEWFIVYFKGVRVIISKHIKFLSLKIDFV